MRRLYFCMLVMGFAACNGGDSGKTDTYIDADDDGSPAGADCNDDDDTVHPRATEVCNHVDDDCDGTTDEDASDATTMYTDADGDGFGSDNAPVQACNVGDGIAENGGDCNDGEDAIHPDAEELCDGVDDNCDGATDEATATDAATWYPDSDGDGYGDAAASTAACDAPEGMIDAGGDCDDTNAAAHPGGTEHCDGVDNDCDPTTLEDGTAWWIHLDGSEEDATEVLAAGTAASPAKVEIEGELHVCTGTWYLNATVSENASVIGHPAGEVAILDGGGVGTIIDVLAPGIVVSLSDLEMQNGYGTHAFNGSPTGGTLACDGDATVRLTNIEAHDNYAGLGGAVYTYGCSTVIEGSTFTGNSASFGGAIFTYGGTMDVMDSLFSGNEAANSGGAIGTQARGDPVRLRLVDTLISGNKAAYGGGVSILFDSQVRCTRDTDPEAGIVGNSATRYGGGVLLSEAADAPSLTSEGCDFGEDGTEDDNKENDVQVQDTLAEFFYGDDATFTCTTAGCS